MAVPFCLVVLLVYLPSSFARNPASEFRPPLPDDLPCPPPPPLPQPHQPKYLSPTPQLPPMPPETTYLYYSPPPPMTFLWPEFPFPGQPPPPSEFSSPAPSSFIVRLLSGLGGAVFIALLVAVWRMILTRCWAAPNHPVPASNQGLEIEMSWSVGCQG